MALRLGRGGLVLAAAGIAGLLAFIALHRQAFPVAALELGVDRTTAAAAAERFLAERGADLAGREQTTIFSSDGSAAVFLQRTLGLDEANRAMAEYPVWGWRTRWFRPEEKEEYRVGLDLEGRVTRYEHLVPEAEAGARLALDAARSIAERFLTETMGLDLATLEEIEASSRDLEGRRDHDLEWRVRGYELPWRDDPAAGTGSLRHRVRIQGEEVALYAYAYKVPERFERETESIRSRGFLLGLVALGLMVVLAVLAVVVIVRAAREAEIRWRRSFVLGGVVMVASLVMALNTWPKVKAQYTTEIPYGVYLGMALAAAAIISLIYGLLVLTAAAAGDLETRRLEREAVGAASAAPTAGGEDGGAGGAGLLLTTVYGYAFAFLFLGYVTVFYLIGRRSLGVWMPAEGPLSDVLSTAVPFLAPLATSITAALGEEATFRWFAIPFLLRLFGGRRARPWAAAAALVLPAAVWAFAHSTYPVYPVWVRGIELTIAGVGFGLIYLGAGIAAAVIAHYVIDAVFLSAPLIASGNPGYVAAGVGVVAVAALPGLLGLLGFARARRDRVS